MTLKTPGLVHHDPLWVYILSPASVRISQSQVDYDTLQTHCSTRTNMPMQSLRASNTSRLSRNRQRRVFPPLTKELRRIYISGFS